MAPLAAWGRRGRALAVLAGMALGLALGVAHIAAIRLDLLGVRGVQGVFHEPDSSQYLRLAHGHPELVMQPFASRPLGALVAAGLGRGLRGGLGLSEERAVQLGFLVQAAGSLTVLLVVLLSLLVRTQAPRWMLLAVLLVPFWVQLEQYLVLPDLWYAALLAVLLWLLAAEQWMAAAAMMVPLMLSRESTSLTLVCLLLACARQMRWRAALAAVGGCLAAGVVVARLAAPAQPNPEHLPEAVYMLAKVPWNLLRNVVGLVPWSNANTDLCRVPAWSMALRLPHHLGGVERVGVCGWNFSQQTLALQVGLADFGLLPLLALCCLWRWRTLPMRAAWRSSAVLRFSVIYGGACFLLAPLLGAGYQHLLGYAWPLPLLAVPMLIARPGEPSTGWTPQQRAAAMALLAAHLAVCATGWWTALWPRIEVDAALWVVGAWLAWLWLRSSPPMAAPAATAAE